MIIVIVVFLGSAIFIGILIALVTYLSDYRPKAPFISYKLLMTAYTINPYRWDLECQRVNCEDSAFWDYFNLTPISWLRLKIFVHNQKKQKEKKTKTKDYERMLKVIQKDVERELNKSNKEIKAATNMMTAAALGIKDYKA